MSKEKGKHLSRESKEVIELGVRDNDSARAIARRIGASPSTVTSEVRAHRTVRENRASPADRASGKCALCASCRASGTACAECLTKYTNCKRCRTRRCWLACPDFDLRMCEKTERWPYVCPEGCAKRGWCGLPKCSYDAGDAHVSYRETLSSSRSGICCTQEELDAMNAIIVPPAKQGQSLEAIWAEHAGELPVCVRSGYKYQGLGAIGLTCVDMPRKRAGSGGARREHVPADEVTLKPYLMTHAVEQQTSRGTELNHGPEGRAASTLAEPPRGVAPGFAISGPRARAGMPRFRVPGARKPPNRPVSAFLQGQPQRLSSGFEGASATVACSRSVLRLHLQLTLGFVSCGSCVLLFRLLPSADIILICLSKSKREADYHGKAGRLVCEAAVHRACHPSGL